jgi:hypothetical protein
VTGAIKGTTETDFGLLSEGALKFFASGSPTEVMTLTGGNVGIGTTTPSKAFVVALSGKSGGDFEVDTANNTIYLGRLGNVGATDNSTVIYRGRDGTQSFVLDYPNAKAWFGGGITNVGIGLTNPGAKLESLSTTEQLRLSYDSTNYVPFTVSSTGRITVGRTSSITPTNSWTMKARFYTAEDAQLALTPEVRVNGLGGFVNGNMYGLKIAPTVTDDASAQELTNFYGIYQLTPTGNPGGITNKYGAYFQDAVGIGTTNPSAKLEVAENQVGGGTPIAIFKGTNTIGGGGREIPVWFRGVSNDTGSVYSDFAAISAGKENGTQGNTAGYFSIKTAPHNGSLTERIRVDSAGNVGIGTGTLGNYGLYVNNRQQYFGIGMVVGYGGSDYPAIGYNMDFSAATNSITGVKYNGSDASSEIRFQAGRVETYTAPVGTAGNSITFTQGPFVAQGGNSWTNGSDIRLKQNVTDYSVLDKIEKFRAVSFDWRNPNASHPHDFGVIAQELYQVFPEAVDVGTGDPNAPLGNGITAWGVEYDKLSAIALQGVKELSLKTNLLALSIGDATSTTALIADTLGLDLASTTSGLTIDKEVALRGGLKVNKIGSIADLIAIESDVNFIGRPYFNSDMGGVAVVRKGERKVRVSFEKVYIDAPVVNATITLDASSTDAQVENVLAQTGGYAVTERSQSGFSILLGKPAPEDVTLSWSAFAIKNMRIASSSSTPQPSTNTSSGYTAPTSPVVTASPTAPVSDTTASSTPDTTASSTPTTSSSTPDTAASTTPTTTESAPATTSTSDTSAPATDTTVAVTPDVTPTP